MIPSTHVALVYCDTRRAAGWRAAFAEIGITAIVDETVGDDAEKGAWVVAVPRRKLVAANDLVTAVTQGRRALPAGRPGAGAAVAVAVIVALIAMLARGF
ncbi:MAG: hypothetical protein IPL61_35645 [Myxococcales bacterium]|nr:hypothetical protein [Myxococcales bacterium]